MVPSPPTRTALAGIAAPYAVCSENHAANPHRPGVEVLEHAREHLDRCPRPRISTVGRRPQSMARTGYSRTQPSPRGSGHRVCREYFQDRRSVESDSRCGTHTASHASICFNEPVAAVDGNVLRVVSRYRDIQEPIDRPIGRKQVEAFATEGSIRPKPGPTTKR